MGATLTGSDKWLGGVLGPTARFTVCPRRNDHDILIIDPAAGTATRNALGASLSDATKFVGGALALNGKIYGIHGTAPTY